MVKMIVKKHESREGILLAVCDSDILGKKFETEKLQLDLTSSFYQGEEKTEEELRELMKTAYIINAVGEKTISFLKAEGLVDEENVLRIENVPHVQIVLVRD